MNNNIEDGGGAFPMKSMGRGMSLRDYFAAKALQGLLASTVQAKPVEFAKRAYEVADVMLNAREQS